MSGNVTSLDVARASRLHGCGIDVNEREVIDTQLGKGATADGENSDDLDEGAERDARPGECAERPQSNTDDAGGEDRETPGEQNLRV